MNENQCFVLQSHNKKSNKFRQLSTCTGPHILWCWGHQCTLTTSQQSKNTLQWFTDLVPRLQSLLKIFRPGWVLKGGWLAKSPVLGPFSMQRVFPGSPTTLQSSHVICGSMNCSMETPGALKINLGWRSMYFASWSGLFTLTKACHTHHVDLEEQILLYIMVTNLSNRKVGECFQQSGDTISK